MINEMEMKSSFSALILAGGKSERMGFPKPWLKKNKNATFLADIISVYRQIGIKNVIVVLNKTFATSKWKKEVAEIQKRAILILNADAEKGRLHSIRLGLKACSSEHIFIHNVDNPYVESEVLEQLIINASNSRATIPSYNGKGGHPVIIDSYIKNEIIKNYNNYNTNFCTFVGSLLR